MSRPTGGLRALRLANNGTLYWIKPRSATATITAVAAIITRKPGRDAWATVTPSFCSSSFAWRSPRRVLFVYASDKIAKFAVGSGPASPITELAAQPCAKARQCQWTKVCGASLHAGGSPNGRGAHGGGCRLRRFYSRPRSINLHSIRERPRRVFTADPVL
jgi:hypothetical protein